MKLRSIDLILVGVLVALLALEFFIKSAELFHTQVIIGIIIGFSIGFKLSAVHGSTVSRQAIEMAKKKDDELSEVSEDIKMTKDSLRVELRRKERLIAALHQNLLDRDDDITNLVRKLESQ